MISVDYHEDMALGEEIQDLTPEFIEQKKREICERVFRWLSNVATSQWQTQRIPGDTHDESHQTCKPPETGLVPNATTPENAHHIKSDNLRQTQITSHEESKVLLEHSVQMRESEMKTLGKPGSAAADERLPPCSSSGMSNIIQTTSTSISPSSSGTQRQKRPHGSGPELENKSLKRLRTSVTSDGEIISSHQPFRFTRPSSDDAKTAVSLPCGSLLPSRCKKRSRSDSNSYSTPFDNREKRQRRNFEAEEDIKLHQTSSFSHSRSRSSNLICYGKNTRNNHSGHSRPKGGIDRSTSSVTELVVKSASSCTPEPNLLVLSESDIPQTTARLFETEASWTPTTSQGTNSSAVGHIDASVCDYWIRGKQLKSEAKCCVDLVRQAMLSVASMVCYMSHNAKLEPGPVSETDNMDQLESIRETARDMLRSSIGLCLSHEKLKGLASLLCLLDAHFLVQIQKNIKQLIDEKINFFDILTKGDQEDSECSQKTFLEIRHLYCRLNDFQLKISDKLKEHERLCLSSDPFRVRYAFPNLNTPLALAMSTARRIVNSSAAEFGMEDIVI